MNLNDQLVFLPISVEDDVWADYDDVNGYGGYEQIPFTDEGQFGIIVKKEKEEEFRTLIKKCEEWWAEE